MLFLDRLLNVPSLGLLTLIVSRAAAAAEDAISEKERLAAHLQGHPDDHAATYRFIGLTSELRDYEAGIGALERLLMFNPALSRARKELGFLYARLGVWEVASQHLRAARDAGDLDPPQAAQIDAHLPDIEKQTRMNRLSLRMQSGLRVQSNASYVPDGALLGVGGVGLFWAEPRKGDVNAFQLVQADHELDFGNQRFDRLETHVTAYATQQFSLPQYSVGLFSGSVGPRFFAPKTTAGGGRSGGACGSLRPRAFMASRPMQRSRPSPRET